MRAKTDRQAIEDHAPWKPPAYKPHHVEAVKALIRGDCPPHLQQQFMAYLIHDVCGTYDFAYRPGGADAVRDTDLALGRQFVGQFVVSLSRKKAPKEGEQP